MGEFIELTDCNGERVLVNINHVIKVQPSGEGTCIFFDVLTGNNSSANIYCEHVAENYVVVKKKIQQ